MPRSVMMYLGALPALAFSGVEETEHLRGARFLRKDINGNQSSRKVIDDNGDVPGERPEGGQGERKPGSPEARRDGHDREVAVPGVVG